MTTELIFLVTGILDCCFVLLAKQLGRTWLHMSIVLNLMLISTLGAKLITLFGFTTHAGNVFYACVFLAAHKLAEHHGAKEAYRAAWIGFLALFFYLLMAQFTLRLVPRREVALRHDFETSACALCACSAAPGAKRGWQ